MPVFSLSEVSRSRIHFLPPEPSSRNRSKSSLKPGRMTRPPSDFTSTLMSAGNSSSSASFNNAQRSSKVQRSCPSLPTHGCLSDASRNKLAKTGRFLKVARSPPSSRGRAKRFRKRPRMRSTSFPPRRASRTLSAKPGASANSPTHFWRRLISARSSSGCPR